VLFSLASHELIATKSTKFTEHRVNRFVHVGGAFATFWVKVALKASQFGNCFL